MTPNIFVPSTLRVGGFSFAKNQSSQSPAKELPEKGH